MLYDQPSTEALNLPPLEFQPLTSFSAATPVELEITWQGRQWRFLAWYSPRSTPKAVRDTVLRLEARLPPGDPRRPLVIAPYLSEERLLELESRQVSGVDLCGNGVIQADGLLVFRTGAPNRFPDSSPIKDIFNHNSALVPRVLLVRPTYRQVQDIRSEIEARGGSLTLATISKVLKSLEEQLFAQRSEGVIRVARPAELLDRLARAWRKPEIRRRFTGRLTGANPQAMSARLFDSARAAGVRLVVTGVGSTNRYATAARSGATPFYCSDLEALTSAMFLEGILEETSRFAQLELLEAEDPPLYFDTRTDEGISWASPVQTWLELAEGDKRDRETAAQVRRCLLDSLDKQLP